MSARKILLATLLLWGAASAQKIEKNYDEFNNITTLFLREIKIKDASGNKAEIYFFIANTGDTLSKPQFISMGFAQMSDSWQYLTCNQMAFLIDTIRVNLGGSPHKGSIIGTTVLEQLFYQQPFEFLEKLAAAKRVRFKLCTSVFEIEQKTLIKLREYYKQAINEIQ